MDFFEAVKYRRSIRQYTTRPVPAEVIEKALNAAVLAPNSSNMQTWRIYWVHSEEKRKELASACMSQGAAATAQELVVFVADPSTWKISQKAILQSLGPGTPVVAKNYYQKLMPFLYSWRLLAPFKWLVFNIVGIWRPMPRHPWSSRDIQEVCIKSAALAAENFMLAIAAQSFDTCPMEGFDECRVKKLLGLGWRARVVMVVSVGERHPKGLWGDQFRLSNEITIQKI